VKRPALGFIGGAPRLPILPTFRLQAGPELLRHLDLSRRCVPDRKSCLVGAVDQGRQVPLELLPELGLDV